MNKQSKVIDEKNLKIDRPEPKYKGYQTIVSITGRTLGINGYGEKPYWSDKNNCWMYETSYGLGGTSFGYIREIDIMRIAKKGEHL